MPVPGDKRTIASEDDYAEWASGRGVNDSPAGLASLLFDATRDVQRFCGRDFLPTPALPFVLDEAGHPTTTVTPGVPLMFHGDGGFTLAVRDIMRIDSLTCAGSALTDPRGEPLNFTYDGRPCTQIVRDPYYPFVGEGYSSDAMGAGVVYTMPWPERTPVVVTGRWGYCEVADFPHEIIHVTCELAWLETPEARGFTAMGLTRTKAANVEVGFDGGAQRKQRKADVLAGLDAYRRMEFL
jgi:hypothetical protein